MTGYTLDTNIVTAHLKRNPLVMQRIRSNDLVLVTHNTAHLSRVADLQLEDWPLP